MVVSLNEFHDGSEVLAEGFEVPSFVSGDGSTGILQDGGSSNQNVVCQDLDVVSWVSVDFVCLQQALVVPGLGLNGLADWETNFSSFDSSDDSSDTSDDFLHVLGLESVEKFLDTLVNN